MPETEGFAFFCEDSRQESANKMSYMGVLGPIIFLNRPADAPEDAKGVLSRLVAVGMLRTKAEGPIKVDVEIVFENAPEGVIPRIESSHEVPLEHGYEDTLGQFSAVLPNVPAHPGMKIIVTFKAKGHTFGTSITISESPDKTEAR